MNDKNVCIAIFDSHDNTELAVKALQHGGFDMQTLSIIGKDYHTDEHVVGYYTIGDRMKFWGKQGAFWGGLFGLIFAPAFFFFPGVGPVIVGGPLASMIISALEGAALLGGFEAIMAGLVSLGIPKESVVKYETALKAGKFMLMAHGTAEDVAKAKGILEGTKGAEITVHTS